jgi:hypothetical protein
MFQVDVDSLISLIISRLYLIFLHPFLMLNINVSLFVEIRPKGDYKFRVVSVVIFYRIQLPQKTKRVPSENQPHYQFQDCMLLRSDSCSSIISSYGGDVARRWRAFQCQGIHNDLQYHGVHKFHYSPFSVANYISITNHRHFGQ